ncbi:MAG: hypothetical protein M0Z41_13985 [Peptococcaceae bacterium]|jgi:hypothetical protein|nr:hypothetical protein [Peptococcaceae bacterium]
MEWRAYFSDQEISYVNFLASSYEQAKGKAMRLERAVDGMTHAPVKFLDLFRVVTAADIRELPRPPR